MAIKSKTGALCPRPRRRQARVHLQQIVGTREPTPASSGRPAQRVEGSSAPPLRRHGCVGCARRRPTARRLKSTGRPGHDQVPRVQSISLVWQPPCQSDPTWQLPMLPCSCKSDIFFSCVIQVAPGNAPRTATRGRPCPMPPSPIPVSVPCTHMRVWSSAPFEPTAQAGRGSSAGAGGRPRAAAGRGVARRRARRAGTGRDRRAGGRR